MDGISRSRGWDKEIPHGVLPMEQLVLGDKLARKCNDILGMYRPIVYLYNSIDEFVRFLIVFFRKLRTIKGCVFVSLGIDRILESVISDYMTSSSIAIF